MSSDFQIRDACVFNFQTVTVRPRAGTNKTLLLYYEKQQNRVSILPGFCTFRLSEKVIYLDGVISRID
jgi:hypothetical protein